MLSAFSSPQRRPRASAKPRIDEEYDLKGVNMVAPDQVMPQGETPYAINARGYARNDGETRVAIRTRQGSKYLSDPVGETQDDANSGTVTGDLAFTTDVWVAVPFTGTSDGRLTKFAPYIKKATGSGGHVIMEFYSDNSGFPGSLIGETSILSSDISTTYADVPAYLMDAPTIEDGTQYWVVFRVQRLGTGTYYLAKTAGSGVLLTNDSGGTWTDQSTIVRFKSYVSTAGPILGYTRRYPSTKVNRTMFAMGTSLYAVPDNPAEPVELVSDLYAQALAVRFAHVDDLTMFTDGNSQLRQWDGTDVTVVSGAPVSPNNVIIFKNRAMVVPSGDPTKVMFSALYDFKTWPSVNFFYVPRPKSPDSITAWIEFQDNLVIFTHETKHVVFGSDISTFTRKEAVGTKGAISQEAVTADRNLIYFVADDKMVYGYNGATDQLLSGKIEPELQTADPSSFRLHVYRNQLRVYYRKASTGEQRMALLDLEQKQWWIDTGRNVMGSIEWTQNDNELIEFSSRVGQFFYGERGYSDLGKAIDFKYWTAYKAYGSGAAKDRIKKFRPIVRPAAQRFYLSVGRDIDFLNRPQMRDWLVDGGGAVWGGFKWGDGTVYGGKKMIDNASPMNGRGKHTQYRFEHKGVEQQVELYGYIALLNSGNPK